MNGNIPILNKINNNKILNFLNSIKLFIIIVIIIILGIVWIIKNEIIELFFIG